MRLIHAFPFSALLAFGPAQGLAAQSFDVATTAPSGGQVAAPSTMFALFPGGILSLPAEVRLAPPSGHASFLSRLVPFFTPDVAGIDYQLNVQATNPQNYPSISAYTFDGTRIAPQVFDLTLHPAPVTLAGTLRVSVNSTGTALDGHASGRTELDLDGDGAAEIVVITPQNMWQVTRSLVREVPFTLLPSHPRTLRAWSNAAVAATSTVGYGGVATSLRVAFAHGVAATSVEYGAACGAGIEGWFETETLSDPPALRRTVQVSLRGASPNTPAAVLLGIDRIQVPIPGSSCFLHTTPLAVVALTTDALGRVDLRADLPAWMSGAVSFQFAAVGSQGGLVATQGLSLLAH